ncbi:MAG: hypothetical protein FWE06_03365 [Oscillospiraceae bacterium]|nr:hypothetical protein [Oscillospiraceae bacterium]
MIKMRKVLSTFLIVCLLLSIVIIASPQAEARIFTGQDMLGGLYYIQSSTSRLWMDHSNTTNAGHTTTHFSQRTRNRAGQHWVFVHVGGTGMNARFRLYTPGGRRLVAAASGNGVRVETWAEAGNRPNYSQRDEWWVVRVNANNNNSLFYIQNVNRGIWLESHANANGKSSSGDRIFLSNNNNMANIRRQRWEIHFVRPLVNTRDNAQNPIYISRANNVNAIVNSRARGWMLAFIRGEEGQTNGRQYHRLHYNAPWCAFILTWAAQRTAAISTTSGVTPTGMPTHKPGRWRFTHIGGSQYPSGYFGGSTSLSFRDPAMAMSVGRWRTRAQVVNNQYTPQPGDFIVWTGHIGIVVSFNRSTGVIHLADGNWGTPRRVHWNRTDNISNTNIEGFVQNSYF